MVQIKGRLVISGGAEDEDEAVILKEIARLANKGKRKLVVMTMPTEHPEETGQGYQELFQDLGVKNVEALDLRAAEDAWEPQKLEILADAAAVFFPGGDQLRITSKLGNSPIYHRIREIYERGGTIVGSSAGAAAMPETMIIKGASEESPSDDIDMAPGLGLLPGVVTDSHFAERGRLGRLLAAIARNPRNLGVGIDGNTAIVVHEGKWFEVLGTGAVYVVDGTKMSYSNISEGRAESVISIFGVMLDVLTTGDRYHLVERRPIAAETREQKETANN